jgi:hypothetical protein
MKKVFVSLGLAAGAAGLTSAFGQAVQVASPKMWNVSANLRGFYDDNYTVGNSKKGSWGWEFSPSVSANVDKQQTDFGIRYTFGMYYYLKRADEGIDPLDYTHQADVWLDHSFDETLKVNLSDSFVVAQDPQLVQGGSVVRVNGNNVANHGGLTISKEWTRQFSTATHYHNDLYIYDDSNNSGNIANPGSNPSQAAILNRMEQSVGNDFQWQFQPETMGFVGYQFSWVRYSGDQKIAQQVTIVPNTYTYWSDSRDYNAHYGYVGAQHQFSPNLSATGKVGASYVDSFNDPTGGSTSWAPYADINATYTYRPGSYVQAGFSQDISATSEVAPNTSNGELTMYQQTSLFYFDITHQITSKLTGTLISQYSYQSFKDGAYSGQPDNTVNVGVNLSYQFNRHLAAEAGYNFDELFSNVPGRDNTRNRVYLGLNASY